MALSRAQHLQSSSLAGALAPMDENLLAKMTGVLQALAKEQPEVHAGDPKVQELLCSEGHTLCCFVPPVDGWYCEECGDALDEGLECLRCYACDGLTYCYTCVGGAELRQCWSHKVKAPTESKRPTQVLVPQSANQGPAAPYSKKSTRGSMMYRRRMPVTRPTNASFRTEPVGDDDLDLAIALSMSEAPTMSSPLSVAHVGNCSNSSYVAQDDDIEDLLTASAAADSLQHVKRCYICGSHTLCPLKLGDTDCMHVACQLECLHKLHDQWIGISHELRELDHALL